MIKQLEKPANWQDFQRLCKKIWEIKWACPSIKANGRNGHEQHGVDISGKPSGESEHFGIQCKGKDHYTHAKLTTKEIDAEIEKAKKFFPKLKTFIFATTANSDPKIDEYIRVKDSESVNSGLFSIELYSWDDIAEFIQDYKSVYDWYNNGFINYHSESEQPIKNQIVEFCGEVFQKIKNVHSNLFFPNSYSDLDRVQLALKTWKQEYSNSITSLFQKADVKLLLLKNITFKEYYEKVFSIWIKLSQIYDRLEHGLHIQGYARHIVRETNNQFHLSTSLLEDLRLAIEELAKS